MNYLLPILFVVFLLPFGCKKDTTTQPADTSNTKLTKPDPSDSLVGVYIGELMIIDESKIPPTYTVSHYDTLYTIDTIYIDKISADSFKLANVDWQPWSTGSDSEDKGIYKFQAGNKYGSSGYHNGISITFITSADSLYISRGYWAGYSHLKIFTAKKQ